MNIMGTFIVRILIGLLLFSPLALLGQYTQTTATIVDPNGKPYANCSFNINFVGQNTVPGHPPYTLGGAPGGQFQQQVGGSCNSAALLSARLADNNQISPLPSQWEFSICDQSRITCFVSLCTITGASMDASGCINANAPVLPGGGGGGGPITINALQSAVAPNVLNNGNYTQNWNWYLTGTGGVGGLTISESTPSTNTNPNSVLFAANTRAGSTVPPFEAEAHDGAAGLQVNASGDVITIGSATFIGPLRAKNITGLNQCIMADPIGNLIGTGQPCSTGTGPGPGGNGFGFVVPTQYSAISAALSAAQTGGSGPVVVLPTSTDTTSYVNPANIRVQNYKQNAGGADSLFFRDVSEWGPIDGKTMNCNAIAGSNSLTCTGTFINASAPQGDVNKLILIDGIGPLTGQVNGTMTVASTSGLTGGTPNTTQGIIFNDSTDGCNTIDTMPYGYIALDGSGLPTGNVQWTHNFYGKGCTHPPTSGTINTVGGTVIFTGGTMVQGDLPSVITAVTGPNTITIADNAVISAGGMGVYYGTDVHDTFQTACNSVSAGGFLSNGTLTFSGIGITSHGIDCTSAGLNILGRGYDGSLLVYAGKTPNTPANLQYILNLQTGGGAKIERMRLFGNSVAMPHGLMLTFPLTGGGSWINQMGTVQDVWVGWRWGDPYSSLDAYIPRFQSNIFIDGVKGNDDFWSLDGIYLYGGDTCFDSVNDQATNWHWGRVQAEYCNIGLALVGYQDIKDYTTEFNRVDFTMGSPHYAVGYPVAASIGYSGESSAMTFESLSGTSANPWNLNIQGSLGGATTYTRPDGISDDFANNTSFNNLVYDGTPRGKIILPYNACGVAGTYGGFNMEFGSLNTTQIIWQGGTSNAGCVGWAGGGHLKIDNPLGAYTTHVDVPNNAMDFYPNYIVPLMLDVNRSQTHIGSLNVQPMSWGTGVTQGYGITFTAQGATGSTTYNYQLTCVDSLGNETAAAPVYGTSGGSHTFTVTNGNTTLSANNYIDININPREGCPKYSVYGDNGIGGSIGYLVTLTLEQMPVTGHIYDQGRWTKNTSVHPPTTTNSGSVNVAGNLSVAGLTQLNNVNISGTCTGTGCGTGGGGSMVYPIAGIGVSNGTAWLPSFNATNQIPSTYIPTLNQNTTGTAALASSLDHSPTQCTTGNFAIGITATGSANCSAGGVTNPQVVIAASSSTTPFILKSPDLTSDTLTFTLANGTNPSIISSTGTINFSNLIVSDLAGTGTALLQADPVGNVSRSTTGALYPTAAGIPEYSTTTGGWVGGYNASNPIPSSYIPILNQPTTGNAGTATQLASTPTQCTVAGQFSTGIAANGNANCSAVTITSLPINGLTAATAANTPINNAGYQQRWNWSFTGSTAISGMRFSESTASTNSLSTIVQVDTLSGSSASPLSVFAQGTTNGVEVTSLGNIAAQGSAYFNGPMVIPGLISSPTIGTDSTGKIIAGAPATATGMSTNGTVNQVWTMLTGTTQGWAAGGSGGSASLPYSLIATVSQGLNGNSVNGSCPIISGTNYCPTIVQQAAGTLTTPQSAAAAFPLTSLTTSPNQFVEQKYTLPSTLTGTYSITAQVSFDTVTSGTVNVSFQYACVAPGALANPTLSSVQTFAITVPGTINQLATVTGTPTITGCSANNVLFTRTGITGTAIPSGGNADIWQATLWVK